MAETVRTLLMRIACIAAVIVLIVGTAALDIWLGTDRLRWGGVLMAVAVFVWGTDRAPAKEEPANVPAE